MILHEPVLRAETVGHLVPAGRGVFVDCTVGTGGHTEALLEALSGAGDADSDPSVQAPLFMSALMNVINLYRL